MYNKLILFVFYEILVEVSLECIDRGGLLSQIAETGSLRIRLQIIPYAGR
jgi:hypothetical protein